MITLRTQHAWADVDTHPRVAMITEHLTAEPTAATNVEQKTGPIGWQIEQFQGTFGHGALNFNDAGTAVRDTYTQERVSNECSPSRHAPQARVTYLPAYFFASS